MLHIDFYNEHDLYAPSQSNIHTWLTSVLHSQDIHKAEISISIVSQEEMTQLNSQYRNKNKVTNILSFPFEAPPGLPKEAQMANFLGDLVICSDQLELEAKTQLKMLEHHWCHILIHGILHLLGYDHITEQEAEEMESLEVSLLRGLNIDNPYLENE